MRNVIFAALLAVAFVAGCSSPTDPTQDSGVFVLSLHADSRDENSWGEGYTFETGEKTRITWDMQESPDFGTYTDIDGWGGPMSGVPSICYSVSANPMRFGDRGCITFRANETRETDLTTKNGVCYHLKIEHRVLRERGDEIDSEFRVTYKLLSG